MEKHALILATTGDFMEKFELSDARLLQRLGYRVHYGANLREPSWFSGKERLKKRGILTHQVTMARSPFLLTMNLRALREILELIRRYHICLIHCHTPVGGLLGRLAGIVSRERPLVIYTAHGFHFYRGASVLSWLFYYPVEYLLARGTDILLVINREDQLLAKRLPLRRRGEVYRIPGVGLDRKKFSPPTGEERQEARRQLGIGEDFFLVSVGELNENKNHRAVLEALMLIRKERGSLEGFQYGICGGGYYQEQLDSWIRRRGLSGRVRLYGHCSQVRRVLAAADLFVFPSRREGLGMAALEALSMGIPVLAADNRGSREYVRPGENGYLCPWDQPEAFAAEILRLQGMEENRRRRMRKACLRSSRPFDLRYSRAVMERIYRRANRMVIRQRSRGKGKFAGRSGRWRSRWGSQRSSTWGGR